MAEYPVGSTINNFTVIGYEWSNQPKFGGRSLWCFTLRCICGSIVAIPPSSIINSHKNHIQSCSCLAQKTRVDAAIKVTKIEPFEAGLTRIFNSIRNRAIRDGHCFDLIRDDVRRLAKSKCTYCGLDPYPVEYRNGRGRFQPTRFSYMGIDRVDSNIGYIKSNVVPCCKWCNIAKNQFSTVEFLTWAKRLARFQGWIL
jgi:hypothetical protein